MMNSLRKMIKPVMIFIVIIFAVSCFFMYGAGSLGGRGSVPAVAAGGDAAGDYDVAIVNGERIPLSRLEMEVAQLMRVMGLDANDTSGDTMPSLRNMVIERMAMLNELDKEIVSRKITVTKEELDSEIKEIEAQFPTKELYLQQLQSNGITEEELRKSIEESVKRNKVVDAIVGVVSTDEAELRNFYNMMKTYAFQKQEGFSMDVAHFLTGEAAEAARKQLASGKKWDDVMTAASSDVSDASTSDSRIFIPSEQMTGDVAFIKTLSMDVPSKVVAFTSDDHMIVVKRAREEAGTASFDEVSADIEQMLVNQKRSSLQSQFMNELRAKAKIEFLDQELFKTISPDVSADSAVSGDVAVTTSSADVPAASGDTAVTGAVTSGD